MTQRLPHIIRIITLALSSRPSPQTETIRAALVDEQGNPLGFGANINDVGRDIVLLIGQSNMAGHSANTAFDANLDFTDPRILQRPPVGTYVGQEVLASDPLWHHDRQVTGCIGLGMSFAERYAQSIPPNRTVLLLPQAQGGTGFQDNRWNPGNDLYTSAVNNTNAAIAANANNRLAAILWHQGENDVNLPKSTYCQLLDSLISGLRGAIIGASNVPFILGELAPTWVTGNANRAAIQEAIQETPTRQPNCFVVSSSGLAVDGTGIHFTGASFRTFGERYFNSLNNARRNPFQLVTPSTPSELAVANISSAGATITWNYGSGVSSTFNIRYRVVNTSIWTTVSATQRPRIINNLSAGTNYEIQIQSVNSAGVSDWTNSVLFATPVSETIPSLLLDLRFQGSLADSSTNNFTPTNTGTSIVADTVRGQVLSVGSNQRVTYPCGIGAAHTKMAWVFVSNVQTVNQNFISSDDAPAHYFWMPGTGRLSLGLLSDFTGLQAPLGQFLMSNRWNHVACTFSGTTGRLFINGEQVAERTNFAVFAGIAAPAVVAVGGSTSSSSLVGRMDNVKIFNSVLTASQIRQIYHLELI
jgi:Carbohydrate esterase, sialic acid-specific acetylesterase/Concanavalin A-like lectin/glucanases superfamily/Fibronectin type III domain